MSEDYEKLMAEQKAQCPFCKMVKGEIQVIKVYEDELMMAIMDINPATKGHILVFPKEHYPLMNMMPQEVFTHFFSKLKYIAQAQRKVSVTAKTVWYIAGGQAAGQRSLHFMVHMLPRQDGDELPLDLKTVQLQEERLAQLQHLVLETLGVNTKKKTLAKRLEDDDALRQSIIDDPDAFIKSLDNNEELKALFSGIDVKALSDKLREVYK